MIVPFIRPKEEFESLDALLVFDRRTIEARGMFARPLLACELHAVHHLAREEWIRERANVVIVFPVAEGHRLRLIHTYHITHGTWAIWVDEEDLEPARDYTARWIRTERRSHG
jgi:hypothetical protein